MYAKYMRSTHVSNSGHLYLRCAGARQSSHCAYISIN